MIPKNNEIRFEITTRCNYNCIICPREKMKRRIGTMSFELFKMLFDKINKETPQYNSVTFSGMGEPLLDKSIDKKIAYVKRHNFKLLILTNASLLSLSKFKKFESLGLDILRVSLYSDNAINYNKVHGVNNTNLFHKIKNNLLKISEIKSKTKLILTYNFINNHNESYLASWLKFWHDRADLVEVWRPHNWVYGRNYREIQKKQLKTCSRILTAPLQVQVDGRVNMCCFDFDGKLTLGDLKTQSLKGIFSSLFFKKIIQAHKTGNYKNSGLICEYCDQRNRDKSDVMVYNSRYNIKKRVNMFSSLAYFKMK